MTATIARPMSVKLDPDTRARLDQLAQARRRTPHWMLREAVAQYVEREEKREVFRQDTLKAWEEYRTTGLHVTAGEADAWLAQLAEGNDAEPPECHV
jgi:predicted transcriptional regulator